MSEIDRINALNVNDVFYQLLYRIVDFSFVPEGENHYEVPPMSPITYENVQLHNSLILPPYSEFENELVIYKEELIIEENKRILELNRQNDLKNRINAIIEQDNGFPAFYEIVKDQSNYNKYLNKLIEDKTQKVYIESLISQIEAKNANLIAEKEANDYIPKRRNEYPPIGDQLDMIYKAFKYISDSGINIGNIGSQYLTIIQNVKDKYPKPE